MRSVTELLKYPSVIKDNINEILEQSTLKEHQEGASWYHEALSFCNSLSTKYKVPVMNIVGLVSCLSPKCEWNRNKIIAESYLKGRKYGTRVQLNKCERILRAKSYSEIAGILHGPKTKNFFGAILYPNDPKFTVIDVHMIQLCTGIHTDRISTYQYKLLKPIVQDVAKDYNMTPSTLQSVLWISFKNRKIKYFKHEQ